MDRSHETWPLVSVFHYKNDIDPTPDYQRYAVWTRQQQQLLMDSILKGLDIPKLYLRQTAPDSAFKFEAVDGQQRLRAVWDFFDDKYPLSDDFTPEHGGKKYKDLTMDQRMVFDHYQFNLVVIKDATDAEIREMFCRLQNGKPLNYAERRHAMVSNLRDFCSELATHDFFKSVRFGNKRMQHEEIAAQTTLLELAGQPTNVGNAELQKMYEDHANFNANGVQAKKVRKVFNFLYKSFPDRTPELKRGLVLSLYFLVSRLMEEYSLSGREAAVKKFLIEFDYKRRTSEDDNEMVRYNHHMSRSSSRTESISYRHNMLIREFHKFCPDLVPLDSQRGFDEAQRIVVYRRDGGKCKYCGKDVQWEDFNADHVVPHSKGGPTTVENGWLSCASCNKSKGAQAAEQLS